MGNNNYPCYGPFKEARPHFKQGWCKYIYSNIYYILCICVCGGISYNYSTILESILYYRIQYTTTTTTTYTNTITIVIITTILGIEGYTNASSKPLYETFMLLIKHNTTLVLLGDSSMRQKLQSLECEIHRLVMM